MNVKNHCFVYGKCGCSNVVLSSFLKLSYRLFLEHLTYILILVNIFFFNFYYICKSPVGHRNAFCFDKKCHDLPGHVHPLECCSNVSKDFQYMARAIPVAIDVSPWHDGGRNGSEVSKERVQALVCGIVGRFLARDLAQSKLKREMKFQKVLGLCAGCESDSLENVQENGETKNGSGSGDGKIVTRDIELVAMNLE